MTEQISIERLEKNAAKAESLMKALSNKHRLMILCMLQQGELSVSALNELIPIPQSTLSQHLAWLRREKYVKTRREAQTIYYQLDDSNVTKVINVLHDIFCD
ncbi:winged helix-turn-helix transcriptional regulator [Moritella marina ATCC 15381]|uniref:Winged helix-turn-helix transcriptional regulator n=1 Tax=Moritella marina ATCC 15381 TaxID=1202962 RepID=A0A5J6WKX3_MORMI|nr:metalloregulator ArsR/SmtB family transcription factor [Moritella marina]QFI37881.1 winged helix-turn-helix transcriptional regulator [Moritella marina ATCC 15381]